MHMKGTPGSLRQRVISAGSWSLGGHVLVQAIRLGGNLIMTRLLAPEMFGLMSIVYVLMIGLALFSDVGLNQNIVQSRRGSDPLFLNTVWVVQIARGGLIWAIALLVCTALPFATGSHLFHSTSVYSDPLLPLVIAIYSATALISGFESTKLALARRGLMQVRITLIELTSQIVALLVMVAWAWFDRSIWALVAGGVIAALIKTALSHALLHGPSNRLAWDRSAFDEVLGFGKWLFLSSVLGFLVINGDRLLLGGMVSAEQLGLYSIAFLLVNSVQVALSQLIVSVTFPALSEVARDNPSQLRATYYKFRLAIDVLMLFVAGFLFTFGAPLVKLLYDTRYEGAGMVIGILGFSMIPSRYQLAEQCYLALGKPKLISLLNTVRLVALYLLVPLAFYLYGFMGAVVAIVVAPFASLPLTFYFKRHYHLLDPRKELLVLPAILVGLVCGKLAAFSL